MTSAPTQVPGLKESGSLSWQSEIKCLGLVSKSSALRNLGEELVSLSALKYSINKVCSVGYMADNSHEEVLLKLQVYSSRPTSFSFLLKNLFLAFE